MLKSILQKNQLFFVIYALLAAFITYMSMYGIRMPYKAATFSDYSMWGIPYKTILLISQVIGYMLSKFIGIKIISEMKQKGRVKSILIFTGVGLFSLFMFGLTPYPYNFIWLFFNGLPLGLIFGLVFSFLEGRKTTEILTVGLGSSQIVSSGYAKSVGKWLMLDFQISEFWMPFITGCIFYIGLIIGAFMLSQIPPPNQKDIESRTERIPMNKNQRWAFFKHFAPGLILLIVVYIALTILRDFRDGFNVEIWHELGFHGSVIHTSAELPIAFSVLIIVASVILIKKNNLAFWAIHGFIAMGGMITIVSTIMFQKGNLDPFTWMVLTGAGLFFGYSMYTTILFERMIATYELKSNIGFVMYLADSMGYLGSVTIMLYREFGQSEMSYLEYFIQSAYVIGIITVVFIILSLLYFNYQYRKKVKHQNIMNNAIQLS